MSYSFLPSVTDLQSLLFYVLNEPYLFVSSSTVMTTGLVALAMTLGIAVTTSRVVPWVDPFGVSSRLLRWVAPKLALVLAYFGLGSMMLSTEILLRFHSSIPLETETQFRSGLGHLAVAVLGIAALSPLLRRIARREWITSNFYALGYWAFQIAVLTPPWFAFQGQYELVLGVTKALLVGAFAATLFWFDRERRRA
ncbi:MAG: hypothetical protein AUH85_12200 [Chloroflexi bacterium 13_1_40CM_4_68_4]|nr:MAG: hypothetical protein AUH85_12200 [Chloroflexi bacterium 13_1_40CM_4_68_4]